MKILFFRLTGIIFYGLFFYGCAKTNLVAPVTNTVVSDENISQVASINKVFKNVIYGKNTDWMGQLQNLDLDVYLPVPKVTDTKYPLIVFIHGGGFLNGDKTSSQADCELLSSKGFVVATINYREGWSLLSRNTTDQASATYRAIQDGHAALRFLVTSAKKYGIDTGFIFTEGSSSGAITALNLAYINQDSADFYFHDASLSLGKLKNAGNGLRASYKIKGVASMWGSLVSQYLITNKNALPTIFFHGELDQVIPWNIGHFYGYNEFPLSYGSKALYERLTLLEIPSVAHIDPTGGHGVYDRNFRQDNIACFFNAIINKTPQTGIYYTEVPNCQ